MLKEACNALKEKLLSGTPLKLIDTVSGMVQTVTYTEVNNDGVKFTKRMPVSYDTNIQRCESGPEQALIPDSNKKGLIYFEENGTLQMTRQLSGGRKMYRGSVLLICWMNKNRSVGDTYAEITKLAYDEIVNKLSGNVNSDIFINLKVTPRAFRQEPSIFSRYTYDEVITQYLRPPFEFFAIDLNLSFISSCAGTINLNPKQC